jgi:hypothetical protein
MAFFLSRSQLFYEDPAFTNKIESESDSDAQKSECSILHNRVLNFLSFLTRLKLILKSSYPYHEKKS